MKRWAETSQQVLATLLAYNVTLKCTEYRRVSEDRSANGLANVERRDIAVTFDHAVVARRVLLQNGLLCIAAKCWIIHETLKHLKN